MLNPFMLKYQILMTKTDNNKTLWANIAKLIREIYRYPKSKWSPPVKQMDFFVVVVASLSLFVLAKFT